MSEETQPTASVLIVEDDPVVRLLATQAVAALGLGVVEAEDGERALELVDAALPDLVIIDVDLPRLGGIETCRSRRRLPGAAQIPVVATTGRNDDETVEQAFEAGASDFIQKPIDWRST